MHHTMSTTGKQVWYYLSPSCHLNVVFSSHLYDLKNGLYYKYCEIVEKTPIEIKSRHFNSKLCYSLDIELWQVNQIFVHKMKLEISMKKMKLYIGITKVCGGIY